MASINYQQRLKKEIYNLWQIYKTLEMDAMSPLDELSNRVNLMEVKCDNYKDSISAIHKSMDKILDIILNKMSILLGVGYRPRRYAGGIDSTIYNIYDSHMIDIPTNGYDIEHDETNESPINPKFYFLLGEYMGKMSRVRELLDESLNEGNGILFGRLVTIAAISEGLSEVEEEIMKYLYKK